MKKSLLLSAGLILALASPSWAKSERCNEHYGVVEAGSDVEAFLDSFDTQFGTSSAEEILVGGQRQALDVSKVAGAFGCKFKGNFPSDGACPNGMSLTRGTDVRYLCHSNDPIPEGGGCLEGFSRVQDYEYERAPAGKIGRFGFFCDSEKDEGQDGFNESVCGDPGAYPLLNHVHYDAGGASATFGCVYLK